ncbi:uncharacterized protein [Pyrus communis]|uniref:uncharacterized protein n=1 Tax=Pyrus communis TaxID=23211 RepID=UPI0035BF0B01
MAIKAQALANFIAEFTPSLKNEATQPESVPEATEHAIATPAPLDRDFWRLHIDGSSNYQRSRAGLILTTPDSSMFEQAITLSFKVSNNEAEYEALLAGLRLAKDLVVKKHMIYYDSQLITNQTSGEYATKHPRMARYLAKVREQLETFQAYTLT